MIFMKNLQMASKYYIQGVFKEELKNRFRCIVNISGEDLICYIPSSCRLSQFLDLQSRDVLLTPLESHAAKTNYAVFAVKYKQSYIVLNTTFPNRIVGYELQRKIFNYLGPRKHITREKNVDGYKCDLFVEDSNTIIEIKSVISIEDSPVFPNVASERVIKQLEKIPGLLADGYNVLYLFVSLNPYINSVVLNPQKPYGPLFKKCIDHGMQVRAYSLGKSNTDFSIKKPIDVISVL